MPGRNTEYILIFKWDFSFSWENNFQVFSFKEMKTLVDRRENRKEIILKLAGNYIQKFWKELFKPKGITLIQFLQ